jgi:hypothetical protein
MMSDVRQTRQAAPELLGGKRFMVGGVSLGPAALGKQPSGTSRA